VSELGVIRDANTMATLVDMILKARVDHTRRERSGQVYFVALHLQDGTIVTRAYWPASGELFRGVLLPPAFSAAISQALGQA
jgi:hypothetical protein